MTPRRRVRSRTRAALRVLRRRFYHTDRFALIMLAVVVGLAGGGGAVLVRQLISIIQGIFFGDSGDLVEAARALPAWRVLLMPALGGLIVGPIIWYGAREARGHGVPEVMLAVLLRRGQIRKRVAVIKAISAAICIGSGGSAGREGPMVQMGSALGSTIGQLFRLDQVAMRTLVGAGAAAGIAAAFNAPIAGTIFALEIILGDFTVAAFSPVVVAAVTATVVSRSFEGNFAAFEVPEYGLSSVWEFLPYSLLGVAAGLVAVGFIVFLYWQEQMWEKLRFPEVLKPALGGLLVGAIGVFFPHILGTGYEAISGAMLAELSWTLLLLLIPLKVIATSVTLSSGGSGGVFAPSLLLGAALGGAFGQAVHVLAPFEVHSWGAYALVGMGALVAATTQAPLAAILILFELTGDYQIILPLMICCIISSIVAGLLKEESIYTQKLVWKGIRLRGGREERLLQAVPVRRLMRTDFAAIEADLGLASILARVLEQQQETYPVIDRNGRLVGVLRFRDLRALVREEGMISGLVVAADIALPPAWVAVDDDLQSALEMVTENALHGLPVVDDEVVVGMIYQQDILAHYAAQVKKLDLADAVTAKRSFRGPSQGIDLGDGMQLHEIEVPESLIGLSLRKADLRATVGIEVLCMHHGVDGPRVFPDPDLALAPGDRLVVIGSPEALAALGEPSERT